MNPTEEINWGKFSVAVDNSPFPAGIPDEIVSKALEIDRIYRDRGYGFRGTPNAWEIAGQSTAKLRVVVNTPEKHDPDGSKKRSMKP